jgi:hypothetical protein
MIKRAIGAQMSATSSSLRRSAARAIAGLMLLWRLVLRSARGALSETEVGRSDGQLCCTLNPRFDAKRKASSWLRLPRLAPLDLILRSSPAQKNAP